MCLYFNDVIDDPKINFSNILLDKILHENISVLTFHVKPLGIRLDKIDEFILSLDDKIKHSILFDYVLFNKICDKIKYLISKKSGIAISINHNFGKIRIYSYNSLPMKKY